jgi:hypothetical protein
MTEQKKRSETHLRKQINVGEQARRGKNLKNKKHDTGCFYDRIEES